MRRVLLIACLLKCAESQQAGARTVESGPSVFVRECTKAEGCKEGLKKTTLDANWRWLHDARGHKNCFAGSKWEKALCADPKACAKNCALEGVSASEYKDKFGISGIHGGLELTFVTETEDGFNFGSRVYILDNSETYKIFRLKNREFAIDVDASALPCGLNGAAYFVEMDKKGGKGGNNKAGAKFGTGYCDAQCPHDVKFISGEANLLDWNHTAPSPFGRFGSCCAEMDIWEANSMAAAFTAHPCTAAGAVRCEGAQCSDTRKGDRSKGICDKDGCDFHHSRLGEAGYYGPDPDTFRLDSSRTITVVTQFITTDGTDTGDLKEIRRFFVQDGRVVPNSNATILGPGGGDRITDGFCKAEKAAFRDVDDFSAKGGLKQMGAALDRGMVLALSLRDDSDTNMLWLDSTYPPEADPSKPGVVRGPCPGGEGSTPAYLRAEHGDAYVRFTNIAVGEIGSTQFDRTRRLQASYV